MRQILCAICSILIVHTISAQVVDFDMINQNSNTHVKLTLKDAQNSEPIPWASVYLIPDGDTTITHFALSNDKGDVLLKDVPVGKYEVNAEIIGYTPHKKLYMIKRHWDAYDLGIIKMKVNPEYLDVATVSAIGNPIVIKKDTIEFNAASFRVGENAMLEDLIKKMPGMEVSSDGSVTLNGEKIDKITVGGKTFFFNDPTAALRNLPAKIVEKIKVIDKTKDAAEASGIVTKDDKEKVMDVELKEEYSKGWFGNAKLGGGATLTPDNENELFDDRKWLYNGNAMVTGYTEKDQVVLIGNAFNAIEPGAKVGYYGGTTSDFSALDGLHSAAQAGINYNTSRIKKMESTLSVNYKNNGTVDNRVSSRTTFQQDSPNVMTNGVYNATGHQNSVNAAIELNAQRNKKYYLYFTPTIAFARDAVNKFNSSVTTSEDTEMNSSESTTSSSGDYINSNANFTFGLKQLGKPKRTFSISGAYTLDFADKNSHETSYIRSTSAYTSKDLFYKTDMNNISANAMISYSEPLHDKWVAQARFSSNFILGKNIVDATNADGTNNDYYSSFTNNRYFNERGHLTVEYSHNASTLQFGLQADAVMSEITSKSMGITTTTGKNEWLLNWTPFIYYLYNKNGINVYVTYSGYSNNSSGSSITPALNISNPVQITAGNIYLKPQYTHSIYSSLRHNNRETFSFISATLSYRLATRANVQASWMDGTGVRYSIPVNALKPQTTASAYITYRRPITKDRQLTLELKANSTYTGNTSYQAPSKSDGLDLQNFNYNSFMETFWGNASGDKFYNGKSGFAESRTNSLYWAAYAQLKYSIDKLDASIKFSTSNRISRYSLDPTANMNIWDNKISTGILYKPGKNWEFDNYLSYRFYRGYSNGFGAPECIWNITVSKSIKSVTLSLKAADILNQTKNLQRKISAEYIEDEYSNVLGRFFLFSVSFNFGKMNAKKNRNVENAMWNMM